MGFNSVIFIMALFTILPKIVFFYQKSNNFALTVIIFYSTTFFIFDFTQIRQAFAIGVFMCSIRYILSGDFVKYLILIITASLFHYSALILLPGYFLFNKSYNNLLLYLIVISCSIISFFQIKIRFFELFIQNTQFTDNLNDKIIIYQQSDIYSFISIKQIVFGFFFIYIKNKAFTRDNYTNILVNLYVFGIFLATILNQISEIAFRVKWYFFWTECILVILLIAHFSKRKFFLKIIMNSFFILYYFSIFFILLDNLSNKGQFIFPYKFYF